MFDVKQLDSDHGRARLALVVPKFGHTAVERNKLKRRLRELGRVHVLPVCSSDILLRAKRIAYDASFDQLREEVQRLAGVLAPPTS